MTDIIKFGIERANLALELNKILPPATGERASWSCVPLPKVDPERVKTAEFTALRLITQLLLSQMAASVSNPQQWLENFRKATSGALTSSGDESDAALQAVRKAVDLQVSEVISWWASSQ